jgi:hypothetical protein
MPLENNHDGKEKHYPDELRDKIDKGKGADKVAAPDPAAAPLGTDSEAGGHTPTSEEVEMAMSEELKPVSPKAQGPELDRSYYAEASLTKKITVFAITTALVLIALGAIYAYLPLGIVK